MIEHMFGDGDLSGANSAAAARLETDVAEVCGLLHATTARLVSLIAQVLAAGAWEGAGVRSIEHWVAWKCGVSAGRARRLVAMARRLPELPSITEAFVGGELSEDQVHVVCRHAPVHTDAEMTEFARYATVAQLQRTLSSYSFAPAGEAEPVEPVAERRDVGFCYTDDGRWRMSANLPAHEGALVERGLGEVRNRLFAEHDAGEVTWADALLAMSDTSLGADTRRRSADRTTVLVHVQSSFDGDRPVAHLHMGPALSDNVRRYVTCDAKVRPVYEHDGRPVSVGRKRRTVPDATRTVIEDRDRGCRVPGCPRTRWLDGSMARSAPHGALGRRRRNRHRKSRRPVWPPPPAAPPTATWHHRERRRARRPDGHRSHGPGAAAQRPPDAAY